MSGAGAGLDSGRVAQLRVERSSGAGRGSGYRLTDTAVLTAAHVVAGASSVEVVFFNPDLDDEWSVPATVGLCQANGDVAVLIIDPPDPHRSVERASFGRVGIQAAVFVGDQLIPPGFAQMIR